ncbi:Ankyrin repeat domain-containing protein 13C [Lobosporangium transversale]|nr:Ankyrin repeat domain-containing protein 13C [Lobosporangium transversale]
MSGPELVIIDRVKKITQRLATSADDEQQQAQEPTDEEIEREVSVCFNSDITSTNVPTSAIKFHRAKTGLWGYRTDKVEKVGEYECAVWKMDGVEFRTRVRTEHLKDEYGKPLELHKAPAVRATKGHHHHHHHGAHGHGRADLALIGNRGGRQKQQPRRPIQPLLATFTESEPIKDSDAKGDTTALEDPSNGPLSITASSEPVEKNDVNGIDQSKHQRVMAPKKHARSTGTISDDAFFETALEEAEEELGNEDDPDTADDMEFVNPKAIYRKSLPPPPPPTITFEEYFDQSKQGELHLGRPLEQKESRKTFGATLWMYDGSNSSNVSSSASGTLHDNKSTASIAASSITSLGSNSNKTIVPQFPLTIERIIPLLEVIGMDNNRLVGKLKEFLEFQLPPGFPIRANIPVYPSLSADVTFVNYDAQRIINDDMFDVPGESEGFMEGLVVRSMGQDDT